MVISKETIKVLEEETGISLTNKKNGVKTNVVEEKKDSVSPEKELFSFIIDMGFKLYSDQFGNPVAVYQNKYYEVKSGEFRNIITRNYFEKQDKIYNETTWRKLLGVLESICGEETKFFPLRCHQEKGKIYYDDGINVWEFNKGQHKMYIKTENDCPVIFRRYTHQEKAPVQPNEEKTADLINKINSMFRINDFREEAIIPMFNSTHPEPMKLIVGPPGAAKSTYSSIIKKLVDPDQADRVSLPDRTNIDNFSMHRQHFYVILYDNVREFYKEQSDQLCMMITGGTGVKRALYTNGELYLSKGLPRIVANGLRPEPSEFNDLLDRTLIVDMQRIESSLPEAAIWNLVDEILPKLRYCCLRDLSLSLYESIDNETDLPRMSEYTTIAERIRKVWGREESFTQWFKKQMIISDAVGNDDPTAIILKSYLEANDAIVSSTGIIMSATNWRIKLLEYATEKVIVQDGVYGEKETNKFVRPDLAALAKERKFPDNGTWMGRRFRDLTPLLGSMGYRVDFDRNGDERPIIISKI